MSNRLFQGIVCQMRDAVDRVIGVVDENGIVISCSDPGRIGESRQSVKEELTYVSDFLTAGGFTYRLLSPGEKNDYIVFVEGEDRTAEKTAALLAISLGNIKSLYDEKYDKSSFIKNVLLDNILPGDIYIKSRELHFTSDATRVVFYIKFLTKGDVLPFDIIQNMFPDKNRDYVIGIGEQDIVLVREIKPGFDPSEAERIAMTIVDTVGSEFFCRISVGIGTPVDMIKNLARSFKEAQIAIEVGKLFDTEKSVISYDNLGIARLIYQLPTTLCEMFLAEVFKKNSFESLDHETLITIQAFFENNLNVSETARKLFVHRNTLVYRLDKIRKITDLDLREFEDAITFKVALMVKKYLTSKPAKF